MPETDSTLPKINLASSILSDFDKGVKNEWLVTNGLGGYTSSTALGLNTRKYHGLLVAAFNPPTDRHVMLSRLDEKIVLENQTYLIGMNEDSLGIHPAGYRFLTGFSLAPFPTYTYAVDTRFRLRKTIFMPFEKNASVIMYEIFNESPETARISLAPFVNFRNFHGVTQRNQMPRSFKQASDRCVIIKPSTKPSTLILLSTLGRYVAGNGEWVESYYRVEAQRGESSLDYCYKPGFFEFDVVANETMQFSILTVAGRNESEARNVFSSTFRDPASIPALYDAELKRRTDLITSFHKRYEDTRLEDWLKWLALAADSFIVDRESTGAKSVIAGYHWFNDWGRDSLISLPGLTLVTGRFEDARNILLTFQSYCREGLAPNSFPDSPHDTPAYNTVDATLWYFNAVWQYLKYTGDSHFVQDRLWQTLESIVEHHGHGTLFNILLDEDGLLAHGPQLTWMDAAPDGIPVTPREGKAVEIQALWYNALKIMQLLTNRFGHEEKADSYGEMAEKARRGFLEKFWNPQKDCLFDVVTNNAKDDSLRPNQILAVSLDFTMLDKERAEQVVETVWKQLLTPYGLRTLASTDPRYIGKYRDDRWQRDRAYHNGTVWPWLLGPFTTAFLKIRGYEAKWRSLAHENFLKPLFTEELYRAGLGSVSEVVDGDSPHEPGGCVAQAWSVAEPLRAYIEDVLLRRPAFERRVADLFSYRKS